MFDILGGTREIFGLVFVSDGQNEGPLIMAVIFYCSACSPLVWNNLGLLHIYIVCVSVTSCFTMSLVSPSLMFNLEFSWLMPAFLIFISIIHVHADGDS